MQRSKRHPVVLALTALVTSGAIGATAATAGSTAEPGVTPTSVLLGATAPLTGASAAEASIVRGADAYFRYVNGRGGVAGRRIEYRYLDDAGSPSQTVVLTRQLVEKDGVFAIFNTVGTDQNDAIRDYLNTQKVPQLFAASGATSLGDEAERYPGAIGLQPSHRAEGWVYGKYVARTRPAARVAVLVQDDTHGRELLAGLRRGLERSKVRIVAVESHPATAADVGADAARLRASRANVLALFTAPKHAIQAYATAARLAWRPGLTIVDADAATHDVMTAAAERGAAKIASGTISIAILRNASDPRWAKDRGVELYRQVLREHAPGADAADVGYVYGMAAAWTLVEVLKRVGSDLSRQRLVEAVSSLNLTGNPFLLPGIVVRTGPDDHFPIEQMLLQRWQKGSWRSFGGLWVYRSP